MNIIINDDDDDEKEAPDRYISHEDDGGTADSEDEQVPKLLIERVSLHLDEAKVQILKRLGLFTSDDEIELAEQKNRNKDDLLGPSMIIFDEGLDLLCKYWRDELILRIKSGMIRKEDQESYSFKQLINSSELSDKERMIAALTQSVKNKDKLNEKQEQDILLLSSLLHRRDEMMDIQRKQHYQELLILREQNEKKLPGVGIGRNRHAMESEMQAYINVLHDVLAQKMKLTTNLIGRLRDIRQEVEKCLVNGTFSSAKKKLFETELMNLVNEAQTVVSVELDCRECTRRQEEIKRLQMELSNERFSSNLRFEAIQQELQFARQERLSEKREGEEQKKMDKNVKRDQTSMIFKLQERISRLNSIISGKSSEIEEKNKELEAVKEKNKKLQSRIRVLTSDIQKASLERDLEKNRVTTSGLAYHRLLMIEEDLISRVNKSMKENELLQSKIQDLEVLNRKQLTQLLLANAKIDHVALNGATNSQQDEVLRAAEIYQEDVEYPPNFEPNSKGDIEPSIGEVVVLRRYADGIEPQDKSELNSLSVTDSLRSPPQKIATPEQSTRILSEKQTVSTSITIPEYKYTIQKLNPDQGKAKGEVTNIIPNGNRRRYIRRFLRNKVHGSHKIIYVHDDEVEAITNALNLGYTESDNEEAGAFVSDGNVVDHSLHTEDEETTEDSGTEDSNDGSDDGEEEDDEDVSDDGEEYEEDSEDEEESEEDEDVDESDDEDENDYEDDEHDEYLSSGEGESSDVEIESDIEYETDSDEIEDYQPSPRSTKRKRKRKKTSVIKTKLITKQDPGKNDTNKTEKSNVVTTSINPRNKKQKKKHKKRIRHRSEENLVSDNPSRPTNTKHIKRNTKRKRRKAKPATQDLCGLVEQNIVHENEDMVKKTINQVPQVSKSDKYTEVKQIQSSMTPRSTLCAKNQPKSSLNSVSISEALTTETCKNVSVSDTINEVQPTSFSISIIKKPTSGRRKLIAKVEAIRDSIRDFARVEKKTEALLMSVSDPPVCEPERKKKLEKLYAKKMIVLERIQIRTRQMFEKITKKKEQLANEQKEKWERILAANNGIATTHADEGQKILEWREPEYGFEDFRPASSQPVSKRSWRPNTSPFSRRHPAIITFPKRPRQQGQNSALPVVDRTNNDIYISVTNRRSDIRHSSPPSIWNGTNFYSLAFGQSTPDSVPDEVSMNVQGRTLMKKPKDMKEYRKSVSSRRKATVRSISSLGDYNLSVLPSVHSSTMQKSRKRSLSPKPSIRIRNRSVLKDIRSQSVPLTDRIDSWLVDIRGKSALPK